MKLKLLRSTTVFFTLFSTLSMGQTICSNESRERLDSVLTELSRMDIAGKSINELTVEIGTWFLNTPYVEKTLEIDGDEKLVINLNGLDCTTFLETATTLARIAKKDVLTYDVYQKELEFIRYRDGIRTDYTSRIHYFSDWIYDSQKRGIVKDITKEIGGVVYPNKPSFMSANPGLYPQLSNTSFVERIKVTEAEIASRTYYYLLKEDVKSHESSIKPGDLIAITIAMDNLDISHVGFAIEHNGRIHLLHASSNSKKVEITEKPLCDYLMSHKSQSGIMVCRLMDPSEMK